MKDLQLINELCESRVFRTKQALIKYPDRDKKELFYGILLSAIALAQDTKTNTWAEKYVGSAAAFGNFDYFRTSGTDLYILTYAMQNDLMLLAKPQAQVLVRLYRSISRGSIDRGFVEQTLLRMERQLGITNMQLRNARRIVVNWAKSNETERKQAITRLHRFVRTKAKLAEVLPYLLTLTKGDKGHFGKMSPLKKAAAIAGAGLAGLAFGYTTHDSNRRIDIINNSAKAEGNPLTENRPTQLFSLVQNLKGHPDVEKVISVNYIADGISAFVRDTEGNAYEFEIRPAPHAKGHEEKRGVTEAVSKIACLGCDEASTEAAWEKNGGSCPKCNDSTQGVAEAWQWRCVNIVLESEEEPKCQWCYDTGYATEKHWDQTVKVPCDQCSAERK